VETRIRIWAVMALLALTAGGVAYAQRPATTPDRAPKPRVERAPAAHPHHPPHGPAFSL
jgi:hypothetical protein